MINTIGHNIKEARERAGLTQKELGDLLFATQQTVSDWENGKKFPQADRMHDIADALMCPVSWLLQDEEDEYPDFDGDRYSICIDYTDAAKSKVLNYCHCLEDKTFAQDIEEMFYDRLARSGGRFWYKFCMTKQEAMVYVSECRDRKCGFDDDWMKLEFWETIAYGDYISCTLDQFIVMGAFHHAIDRKGRIQPQAV